MRTLYRTTIVFLVIMLPVVVTAQKQERLLKKLSWQNEPIRVVVVKIQGREIKLNEKFPDDDDWLRGLKIKIRNMSDKAIIFINLRLDFPIPEGSAVDVPSSYDFEYGRNPQIPIGVKSSDFPPALLPGETREIMMADPEYNRLIEFLEGTHYPRSIRHVEIVLDQVLFDDDSMWQAGGIFRRDPNDLGTWKRVKPFQPDKEKPPEPNLKILFF